jgi:hypothetical protein
LVFNINEQHLVLDIVAETDIKVVRGYFLMIWMILQPVLKSDPRQAGKNISHENFDEIIPCKSKHFFNTGNKDGCFF